MSSKKNKKNKKNSSSKAAAKSKEKQTVIANPRIVAALTSYDATLTQAKSYLVDLATIVQEEQCTKAEVVASIMQARPNITEKTAKEQYSRLKKILNSPESLEALRTGEATLATVREKTTKKQANPSAKKKAENLEKKFVKSVNGLIDFAKESGTDLKTIIESIRAKAKAAGVK